MRQMYQCCGGYVVKQMCFPGSNSTCFTYIYTFLFYSLTLPRKSTRLNNLFC
jgi:hypothetical protein